MNVSDELRIAYAEAQFDRVIYAKDRESVVVVQGCFLVTPSSPAGVTVESSGDADLLLIEQGTQELLGLLAALISARGMIVFRTSRRRRFRSRSPSGRWRV